MRHAPGRSAGTHVAIAPPRVLVQLPSPGGRAIAAGMMFRKSHISLPWLPRLTALPVCPVANRELYVWRGDPARMPRVPRELVFRTHKDGPAAMAEDGGSPTAMID